MLFIHCYLLLMRTLWPPYIRGRSLASSISWVPVSDLWPPPSLCCHVFISWCLPTADVGLFSFGICVMSYTISVLLWVLRTNLQVHFKVVNKILLISNEWKMFVFFLSSVKRFLKKKATTTKMSKLFCCVKVNFPLCFLSHLNLRFLNINYSKTPTIVGDSTGNSIQILSIFSICPAWTILWRST